jgi:hypothetical protein
LSQSLGVTVHARSDSGTDVIINNVIIKNANGTAVTSLPTYTTLTADGTFVTIGPLRPVTGVLIDRFYSIAIVTAKGNTFVSPLVIAAE